MLTKAEQGESYVPTAIYYQEADFLEYVREDVPYVARRVDEYLTLVLDMYDRRVIGVRIKGFRHLFKNIEKSERRMSDDDFFKLSDVFEDVMRAVGDSLFAQIERRRAYEQALEIANADKVRVDPAQMAA